MGGYLSQILYFGNGEKKVSNRGKLFFSFSMLSFIVLFFFVCSYLFLFFNLFFFRSLGKRNLLSFFFYQVRCDGVFCVFFCLKKELGSFFFFFFKESPKGSC